MKKQILAAGALLGFAAVTMAPSAAAEVPLTLSAGAAHWYFNSDMELDNMNTPWAGLEWAFNDKWAAELSYAQDDASSTEFRGTQTEVSFANLGLKYYGGSYIGDANRFRPYAAMGVGMLSTDPQRSNADSNDDTTVNGGLGVRWMITQRFGASLDARLVYNTDTEDTRTIAYAGLNYYFGAVNPPPPPAAPAPLDSDGDGVTDDMDQCPGTPAGTRVDAKGCPLPVAQVASIKLKVNFAFDSTVVQEKYFTDLGELAKFLKRFEDVDVKIDGYTDSVGPETYNQQLSQRRAQAVVDTLVNQHGIAASRLQAVGYGEANPVASNDTAEGRAENRRVMASLEVEYSEN
jgi:OOP family OmpA-OmpF porin